MRSTALLTSLLILPCIAVSSAQTQTAPPTEQNESDGGDAAEAKDANKTAIYLSAFFSLGGKWDGSGILPAVEMALDHINAREDILAEYELRMVWNDTRCDSGLATRVFFDQLYHHPTKLMILGPPCSTGAQAVAETATHWHLITLSYSAASSALSNREQYPLFFRTYLPDAGYNPARIRLMKDFGWNRVATIHENHDLFSLAIDNLLTLMKESNITAIKSESFAGDPENQIENLKKGDAKIIVASMYENMARRMFCEAYKQDMTGPDYVWILIGWYGNQWWEVEDPYVDCSIAEMKEAVEGSQYISTESLQLSTSPEPTVAGITASEYERLLRERLKRPENSNYAWNGLSPYGYDATWTVALMLDEASKIMKARRLPDNSVKRLEDFTYDDEEMTELFFDLLTDTYFLGVSGPVSFKNGDRVGVTQIEQLQPGCDDGWELFGLECYSFREERRDFHDARRRCRESGGDLASVNTGEQWDYVMEKINDEDGPGQKWLLGLTLIDGHYKWTNGKSLNSTISDEITTPLFLSNKSCIVLDRARELHPVNCEQKNAFICQTAAEYKEEQIALYTEKGDILEYISNFQWRGGKVPLDHTPTVTVTTVEKWVTVNPSLYFAMSSLASVGIIMACGFFCFNVKYREQRYVKMSSPNLNNIIILGSIFVYAAVFLYGLDSSFVGPGTFETNCQIRAWVISVGFVVAYGAMFSKTWRVHRVATLKTPKRRIVTDRQLFVMVLVLVLIDVTILTVWQILAPFRRATTLTHPENDPDVPNQIIQPIMEFCYCDNIIYWLGALYAYKGLLLIFGTFLAWETRKVSIPALNDSKYIGMSVYNVIVLSVIGVAVSPVINHNVNASFCFMSAINIFCTSITLLLVFVPKILSVRKYPEGKTVSTMKSQTGPSFDSTRQAQTEENSELKDKVQQLQAELDRLNGGTKPSVEIGVSTVKGCGFWCYGLVCGCSSPMGKHAKSDDDIEKHAHVNETVDSGRADSIAEF
ncbi:gamma-aminobutyric acid type B receptor subunit 2-like [Ptychodera flava]|uniref:gamma-aminobutyric acid type B receptor subunit 2-like n=1 Tax=Ptychodera flava TaxID=63121 RepID=UPI003969C7B9